VLQPVAPVVAADKADAASGEPGGAELRPLLIIPYTWIGDFVRGHTVVAVARQRWPGRPIDLLSSRQCAPLADYMPGVRRALVHDMPRGRMALGEHLRLAALLRGEHYGAALILSRKWKAALAPALAGIPVRTGMLGEARFGLVNDVRLNERALPRMVDRSAILALPKGAKPPAEWPAPRLVAPAEEIEAWRRDHEVAADARPVVALCPGAVGPGKQWPEARYTELARRLREKGVEVWVLGGPGEGEAARRIAASARGARDLTGSDLRQAIRALAAARVAVANDSGLLHVAAALGTPAVGLFGPSDPALWAPLNPLAATIVAPASGVSAAGTPGPHASGRAIGAITVDEVLGAVVAELDRRG